MSNSTENRRHCSTVTLGQPSGDSSFGKGGDTGPLPCVSICGPDPCRFAVLAYREGICFPDISSSKMTKGNTVVPLTSLPAPKITSTEVLPVLSFWPWPLSLFPHTIFFLVKEVSILFLEVFFLLCLFVFGFPFPALQISFL